MKTIMLLLGLMAGAAWGQKAQTCKACPSVADMDRQLDPALPKHPKPERAKQQRPPKQRVDQKKAAGARSPVPPVAPVAPVAPASANPSTRGSGS